MTHDRAVLTVLAASWADQRGDRKLSADKTDKTENPERREALIKIGKYAAYSAPAMLVTVGTAKTGMSAPISTPTPT